MTDRSHNVPAAIPSPKPGAAPAARETGWLPDCVYTGDKFEAGLAFFADDLGHITRFSREAADLAAARRLGGQAALPGLVNAHSQAWQRVLRGRAGPADRAAAVQAAARLTPADLYDAARMAFMEMLLAGLTCAGEFHTLHHQPDGTPWPEPNLAAHELLRAARDTGIRLALLPAAAGRAPADPAQQRGLTPQVEQFLRHVEALREYVARNHPGDDAWVGVAAHRLRAVPLDHLKAIAAYAHTHRLRLHLPVAEQAADNEACAAEHGRTPVALLAEHGVLDKRCTVIHALQLTADETRLLGAARATVCVCPTAEAARGDGAAPAAALLAAGAALALGTDSQAQINLLEDARHLASRLRTERSGSGGDPTPLLFQALTAAGARSLGAPSGALEVGRPADFFTVNLFDPSIAGAGADGLQAAIMSSLERRAIREIWVGGRQRVANGRHPLQGAIVSRFVELQTRLWGGAAAG
ncbi:MAG TPA: formimidoylglutamate deiminase [Opitutaceae bacterium]|nr:formimidoylglutamate deiminase [Opitutaceae bacterium]